MVEQRELRPLNRPFLIRGHHLSSFWLASGRESPKETAEGIREGVSFDTDLEYVRDVLGKDPAAFEQKVVQAFEEFLKLPEDHPVRVVPGKDLICQACAVGKHCLPPDSWERIDPILDELIQGVISFNEEHSLELPVPDVTLKGLSTTAGVMRRVFKYLDFDVVEDRLRAKNQNVGK